jgi:hypothetical protein
MSRELELLLELFHAIKGAPAGDAEACEARYLARLAEVSSRLKISQETLHRMILRKHLPWLRANTKPSSLPPKA